jgi:hypothetical protein
MNYIRAFKIKKKLNGWIQFKVVDFTNRLLVNFLILNNILLVKKPNMIQITYIDI